MTKPFSLAYNIFAVLRKGAIKNVEYVAILVGAIAFCFLYTFVGSYKKREASKELYKRLKAMNFSISAEISDESTHLCLDEEHKTWFVRTNLQSSIAEIRPSRELASFEVRESGNLILSASAGKPFSTVLFSDIQNSYRLPQSGKCSDFYITVKTRGNREDMFSVSVLNAETPRGSSEYKNALALTRHVVRSLAKLQGSDIIETKS